MRGKPHEKRAKIHRWSLGVSPCAPEACGEFARRIQCGRRAGRRHRKSAEAAAKVFREKGLDHFKKKEYAQAIEAFQKALALQRTAGAMAQMASSLNALGRYDEALRWYETVLEEFPKASTGLRSKVNGEMTDLVAKVGTIAVEGDVIPGARLFVDSRDVGALPLETPVRVLAGVHEVRAEKPGFAAIKVSVEVSAGQPSVAKLVAPKREGKLEIREKHNWRLHIEIDGKDVGLSPQSIPVEVGRASRAIARVHGSGRVIGLRDARASGGHGRADGVGRKGGDAGALRNA
jgi:tetratricopeptide (TPR) repeat protein